MSRTPQTLLAITASLGPLALFAGCGSEHKSATPASTAAGARPGTASLYGTYERDVTKADIERTDKVRSEAGPNQEKPKPDHAVLTIAQGDPQGTITATGSDGFATSMDIDVTSSGKLVLLTYVDPGKGTFCGPEIPTPASYSWKLQGRTLVLAAQKDPCADRDSTLTGKWTRR
jgi:hypothetical protein